MSPDIVQLDYDELETIIKIFERESSEIEQLYRSLDQHVATLHGSIWAGQSADNFYVEMQDSLLPALQRLSQALQIGGNTLCQVVKTYQDADLETTHYYDALGEDAVASSGLHQSSTTGQSPAVKPTSSNMADALSKTRDSSLKNELIRQDTTTPDLTAWLEKEMQNNANSDIARRLAFENKAGNLAVPISTIGAATVKGTAYYEWTEMVDYGAPWDHKIELNDAGVKTVKLAGQEFGFDVVANIHYGYVGAASGFSATELKAGAGIAQMKNDGWDESIKRLKRDGAGSYGDHSRDQAAIEAGIWLQQHPGKTLQDALVIYKDKM